MKKLFGIIIRFKGLRVGRVQKRRPDTVYGNVAVAAGQRMFVRPLGTRV